MFLSWWMQLPWVNQFQKIALKTTDFTYKLQCPENFSALPCNQYISGIHTNPNLGIQMATLFPVLLSLWHVLLKRGSEKLSELKRSLHPLASLTHSLMLIFIFLYWCDFHLMSQESQVTYSPLINSFYPIKS